MLQEDHGSGRLALLGDIIGTGQVCVTEGTESCQGRHYQEEVETGGVRGDITLPL